MKTLMVLICCLALGLCLPGLAQKPKDTTPEQDMADYLYTHMSADVRELVDCSDSVYKAVNITPAQRDAVKNRITRQEDKALASVRESVKKAMADKLSDEQILAVFTRAREQQVSPFNQEVMAAYEQELPTPKLWALYQRVYLLELPDAINSTPISRQLHCTEAQRKAIKPLVDACNDALRKIYDPTAGDPLNDPQCWKKMVLAHEQVLNAFALKVNGVLTGKQCEAWAGIVGLE